MSKSSKPSATEFIDPETFCRTDGRYPEHIRPINITPNILSKSTGSSFVEWGSECKILVSIAPPRPSTRSRTFNPLGDIECRFRTVKIMNDDQCKADMGRIVADACKSVVKRSSFPNAFIIIDVLIIEGDMDWNGRGVVLSATLMGAAVALAQAGVEQIASLVAIPFLVLPGESSILLIDPTIQECAESRGSVGFLAVGMRGGLSTDIVQLALSGCIEDEALLSEIVKQLMEGCEAVYQSILRPSFLSIK